MSRMPLRYLPWMLRDLLLAQGVVLLLVAVLFATIMSRLTPSPTASEGQSLVMGVVRQFGWIFIVYCVAHIVAGDRLQGYYRTLFARPVSPPLHYLMRFLLAAVIVAMMVPVLTLATSVALGWFPISWAMVVRLELAYLLLGGLVFLVSTVTRADWLLGLLFIMLHGILHGLKSARVELPATWDFVLTILPPFHLTVVSTTYPSGPELAHVLLYGAALVLAALAVLRWRPLGAGGRS